MKLKENVYIDESDNKNEDNRNVIEQFQDRDNTKKKIYNISFQEDGNFSFLETEDEAHLIPRSWKENSYAVTHNATCVGKHPKISCKYKESCNKNESIPDATSTPKPTVNSRPKASKSLLKALGSRTGESSNAWDSEEKPLISPNAQCGCGINGSPPPYQAFEDGTEKFPTYGALKSSDEAPISYIFCVHGNKYGVARCCDDLHGEKNDDFNQSHGLEQSIIPPARNLTGSSGSIEHCHTERDYRIDKKARRKLVIASVLCLIFMVVEVVGGILANSLAIATDAAHLLTDLASFMISLFSIWLASRPSTQRMSFGWHRAEVIGATVSVLLIWVVTGILVYAAVLRIVNGEYEVDATIMLITSGVGVGVNIIMGCSLHQHGHSHGGNSNANVESGENIQHQHHGHTHDTQGKEKENINVKAAFIHVIGDFVQSLGVFTAALMIYFKPEWKIVDPICTFIFSVLVLATTISILRNTINVLMEGIPHDINFSVAKDTFLKVPGIVTVHNLRIWGLTTDKTALSAHLVIDPSRNAQDILKEASTKIRSKYNIYEMTLQVEEFQEDMDDCTQCQDSPDK